MKIFKKKLIAPVFLFAVLAGILGGCSESFLTVNPQSALSSASLNTQAGVDAALIGAYAMLDGYNIDNNNTWPADPVNWIMGSITTDDAVKGSEQGDGPENTQLELYQWTTTNVQLDAKYRPMYEGIARTNNTINLLNATTGLDKTYSDNVMGQALFLRAHFHFELYKVFGAIIVVNEDDAAKSNFKKANEATAADALALIVADMEKAVPLLKADQGGDIGRVNQRAAKAYLGKLYMYQLQYSKAEAMLKDALTGISLAKCQRDLFTYATENAPEALFSVQMSLSNKDQARNSNWLNQLANPVGGGFGCCGFHQPKQNLVNAFHTDANGLPLLGSDKWLDASNAADVNFANDNVDPRLDLVVGRDGVPYWDWAVHDPSFIRSRQYSGPYSPKKMQPYSTSPLVSGGWNGASNNGVNVPVIRAADAMLLQAEAEVELGNFQAAQDLVNTVRKRAGNCAQGAFTKGGADKVITYDLNDPAITWAKYKVGVYTTPWTDKVTARKAVRLERRLELAMEGHRLFDLHRWDDMEPGYLATIINESQRLEKCCGKTGIDQKTGARSSYYVDAVSLSPTGDKHRWYPFPFVEVQLSTSNGQPTLNQNPGY